MGKKMIREGAPEGYPTVATDGDTGRHYHLDSRGQRIYHEGHAPGWKKGDPGEAPEAEPEAPAAE